MRSKRLNDDEWREMLLGGGSFLARTNRLFKNLPSDPRCKLCHAPYGGIAGPIMTLLGFGKYPGNPQLCNACSRRLELRGRSEPLDAWSERAPVAVSS